MTLSCERHMLKDWCKWESCRLHNKLSQVQPSPLSNLATLSACGCSGCGAGVLHVYTLCSQVYTFVLFCGGVAARRVAEYCSATPFP